VGKEFYKISSIGTHHHLVSNGKAIVYLEHSIIEGSILSVALIRRDLACSNSMGKRGDHL